MTTGIEPFELKFKAYLEEHNLRKTPERFALLNKAMALSGHFGVDELYEAMEGMGYHVSKATIYSTLELLVDCGILNRHLFSQRKTLYEVAEGNHMHLVCSNCGQITEITEPELIKIPEEMDLEGFRPSYYSTMVYGICRRCIEQEKEKE